MYVCGIPSRPGRQQRRLSTTIIEIARRAQLGSPDWCFGFFKRLFRKTKVGCLENTTRCCEKLAKVNSAQLVGTQDGDDVCLENTARCCEKKSAKVNSAQLVGTQDGDDVCQENTARCCEKST